MHTEQFGPPGYIAHVHSYGCIVAREVGPLADCEGPIEAAHVTSRGAGGGWKNNLVGLCRYHHAEQHLVGIKTFEERYQTDLDLWACAITGKFDSTTHDTGE